MDSVYEKFEIDYRTFWRFKRLYEINPFDPKFDRSMRKGNKQRGQRNHAFGRRLQEMDQIIINNPNITQGEIKRLIKIKDSEKISNKMIRDLLKDSGFVKKRIISNFFHTNSKEIL